MQLTVNQIEAVKIFAPKQITQAIKGFVKEVFTPGWKKWKRKQYSMMIWDIALLRGVETHFPTMLQTWEEKTEKFLLQEFQKWQFQNSLSLRTRELCGEELSENDAKSARESAIKNWWIHIHRTRALDMTNSEISKLALEKSECNSSRVKEIIVAIERAIEIVNVWESVLGGSIEVDKKGNTNIQKLCDNLKTKTKAAEQVAENGIESRSVIEEPEVTPVTTQKSAKFSKHMTIKELKAYAKAHTIHVPGRKTKHRDIYEHILSQA